MCIRDSCDSQTFEWQLIDPLGVAGRSRTCFGRSMDALSAGDWTLRVANQSLDDASITFRVWDLTDFNDEPIVYPFGERVAGTFAHPIHEVFYSFEVPAGGSRFYIDTGPCDPDFESRWSWELLNAANRRLESLSCDWPLTSFTLEAGTHRLVLDANTSLSDFEIELVDISDNVPGNVDYELGTVGTGTHEVPGAFDNFSFTLEERVEGLVVEAVSYTHLTLPTICSV